MAAALVLAVRRREAGAERVEERFEVDAGEARVGDQRVAVQVERLEHFGGGLALGGVRSHQCKGERHPVRGTDPHESEPPEAATVAAAVAVGGVAREV
jgi:hypothetical protein